MRDHPDVLSSRRSGPFPLKGGAARRLRGARRVASGMARSYASYPASRRRPSSQEPVLLDWSGLVVSQPVQCVEFAAPMLLSNREAAVRKSGCNPVLHAGQHVVSFTLVSNSRSHEALRRSLSDDPDGRLWS